MPQAAVRLISTRGSTGTRLREIGAASERGVAPALLPRGKDQLVTKAITIVGEVAAVRVLRLAGQLLQPCARGAVR
jgi:hypothetical protein